MTRCKHPDCVYRDEYHDMCDYSAKMLKTRHTALYELYGQAADYDPANCPLYEPRERRPPAPAWLKGEKE